MKTIYTEKHKLRNSTTELYGGELVTPFECPERVQYVLEAIDESNLGEILPPQDYSLDPVLKVHDAGFVSFLETAWEEWQAAEYKGELIPNVWQGRRMNATRIPTFIEGKAGYYALANETTISGGTWEAAVESKNVALTAMDLVLAGESAAFALCRPPGHHAAVDQYGGYCFLNNAAIAAQHAIDSGRKKVAILDVDFHHGNGTQDIFYERDDVFFASIHGDPLEAFPHFLGHADETGKGKGEGYNLNLPLPSGTVYSTWAEALEVAIAQINDFGAEILVVSLGVDTYENDPISFFKLKNDDFLDYGKRIAALNIPTVFVMEGGYAVKEIGTNMVNVLLGFEQGEA